MINITNARDFSKLRAFIAVNAAGKFAIPPELVDEVLAYLAKVARELKLDLEFVTPDGERIVLFAGGGALAGSGIGYLLGGLPGALTGSAIGAAAGLIGAHLRIQVNLQGQEVDGLTYLSLA